VSLISGIIGTAIGIQAEVHGSVVLEYRLGTSGAWTALSNCLFHEREEVEEYDDQRDLFELVQSATLTCPLPSAALTRGNQVRVGSDDAEIWSVRDVQTIVAQRRYSLSRKVRTKAGPDRGEAT